jgi:hypothetical protein
MTEKKSMQASELTNLLCAVPFQSFAVYLETGMAFEIPDADFALVTSNGRSLIVSRSDRQSADILDIASIARAEIVSQREAAGA